MTETVPPLEPDFRPGAELGRGAFGYVVAGVETATGRPVAIKRLTGAALGDPRQEERILREAGLLLGIRHPRLAALHSLRRDREGCLALVYELVEGRNLAHRLESGGLPPEQVRDLVADLAEALDALHRAALVHRDVKPANAMLEPSGKARLLDFGLVRSEVSGGTLTATGTILGTPAYMAPEQISGGRIGPATDQYTLAAVAMECLTGSPPFRGPVAEVLRDHLSAPPPNRAREAGLAPGVDQVLRRALAKDPGERFGSVLRFAAALGEALSGPVQPTSARDATEVLEVRPRAPRGLDATAPLPVPQASRLFGGRGPDRPMEAVAAGKAGTRPTWRAPGALAILGLAALVRWALDRPPPEILRVQPGPGGVWVRRNPGVGPPLRLTANGNDRDLEPGGRLWAPGETGSDEAGPSVRLEVRDRSARFALPDREPRDRLSVPCLEHPRPEAFVWRVEPDPERTDLRLVVPPGLPPPDRIRVALGPSDLRLLEAEPLPDGSVRVPRLLEILLPRDRGLPDGTEVPLHALWGEPSSPSPVPLRLPELFPARLARLERECDEEGKDSQFTAGPVPLGRSGRFLFAARHGELEIVRVSPLRLEGRYSLLPTPTNKRHTPLLAPAPEGAVWISGPPESGHRARQHVLPLSAFTGTAVAWDGRGPGESDPHVRCRGGLIHLEPQGGLPVERVVSMHRQGPEPSDDFEAWVAQSTGLGEGSVALSRSGEPYRIGEAIRSEWGLDSIPLPPILHLGKLVLAWRERAEPARRTLLAGIDPTTLKATWWLRIPGRLEVPPVPLAGGLAWFEGGRLRWVPDAALEGEVDPGGPLVEVLLELEPRLSDGEDRIRWGWMVWDPRRGLDFLRLPPASRTIDRLARAEAGGAIEWYRLPPGPGGGRPAPGAVPEPLEFQVLGGVAVDKHDGIHRAQLLPGGRHLLVGLTQPDRTHLLVLDLELRRIVAGAHLDPLLGAQLALGSTGSRAIPERGPLAFPMPEGDARKGFLVLAADDRGTVYEWWLPLELGSRAP